MMAFQRNLQDFESQFSGFESSRSQYLRLSRTNDNLDIDKLPSCMSIVKMEDGETYVKPSVDFHIIGHLTNSDGILQVGDKIYKYTYENVYRTSAQNLSILLASNNLKNNPNIEVLPIGRHSKSFSDDRAQLISCSWLYSSSSRKVHGEIKSRIYPGFAQLSVDLDHYRKRLGIWWNSDAPSLSFSGTVASCCCDETGYPLCETGPFSTLGKCCTTVGGNICKKTTYKCIYETGASETNNNQAFDVIMERGDGSHYFIDEPTKVTFKGPADSGTKTCETIL